MAAEGIELAVTGASGETLEELQHQISRGAKVLNTTIVQRGTATMIQTIKSLRTESKRHTGSILLDDSPRGRLSVSVSWADEYTPGVYRAKGTKSSHWCIRDAGWNVRHDIMARCALRVPPALIKSSHVYRIHISEDRSEAWPYQKREMFMIAENDASAQKIVEKRFSAIARNYGGMARSALSRAAGLVSTRPASSAGAAKALAKVQESGMVVVTKSEQSTGIGSGTFDIRVEDNLNYAMNALEGGAAAANNALARAANSVNGYLNAYIEKFNPFEPQEATPFPASFFDPN